MDFSTLYTHGVMVHVLQNPHKQSDSSSAFGQRLDSASGVPRLKVLTPRRWHCPDILIP